MREADLSRRLWLLTAGISLAFALSACKDDKEKPAPPPPEVVVEQVAPKDIPLTFEYAGRIAGSREVEIRPRVSGIILKRHYLEGEKVKKGQLLFTIDPAPFEAALSKAEATRKETERDFSRAESLHKESAISGRDYDIAKSAYEQAEADAKTAKINLGYTTVTTPITGTTSKEVFSEGSLVTADTSLLTTVSQLDPLYVNFAVPDAEAMEQREMIASGKLQLPKSKKLAAEIHFGSNQIYKHEGVIDFSDSVIDVATGSVKNRATLPNADGSLLPGQFVRVVMKGLTRLQAIAVPTPAIMQGPQGTFVYVLTADSKAEVRPITLGMLVGDRQIVETGLNAGDTVITEGVVKVRPGTPVKVAAPKEALPAPDSPPAVPAKPDEEKKKD